MAGRLSYYRPAGLGEDQVEGGKLVIDDTGAAGLVNIENHPQ